MNSDILLLTIPYTKIKTAKEVLNQHKDVGVNILLDTVEIDVTGTLQIVQQLSFQYTISIAEDVLNSGTLEKLIPDLYLLVSLSNIYGGYFRKLPLLLNNGEDLHRSIQLITSYFEAQGETIEPVIFERKLGFQTKDDLLYCSLNDLEELDVLSLLELEKKAISHVLVAFEDNTAEWQRIPAEVKLQNNFSLAQFG